MSAEASDKFVAKEAVEVGVILGGFAGGGVLLWTGVQAFDPAWVAEKPHSHGLLGILWAGFDLLSEHISPTARGIVLIVTGMALAGIGVLALLDAIYWRAPRLVVDTDGIESLSERGKGRLAWKDIASVRVIDGILTVSGSAGNDVSVKIADIDATADEVFAAVARHRPQLLPADKRGAVPA